VLSKILFLIQYYSLTIFLLQISKINPKTEVFLLTSLIRLKKGNKPTNAYLLFVNFYIFPNQKKLYFSTKQFIINDLDMKHIFILPHASARLQRVPYRSNNRPST